MSKITNDGLTRSGTGCFIAVPMATVGVKRLKVDKTVETGFEVGRRYDMLTIDHVLCLCWWSLGTVYVSERRRWFGKSLRHSTDHHVMAAHRV